MGAVAGTHEACMTAVVGPGRPGRPSKVVNLRLDAALRPTVNRHPGQSPGLLCMMPPSAKIVVAVM
jgi:hypothetical protein